MKYPEYDSPFEMVINEISTQVGKQFDDMCYKAIQKVGINVNKEKLLLALEHDSERYRQAYANGYDTGYEKRDDDIVRCKDCKYYHVDHYAFCDLENWTEGENWYCASAEKRVEEEA